MGEILRAILDATCVDQNPAWYSVAITATSTGPLARALGRRSATIQCKKDTYFLMMAHTQDVVVGAAAPPFWEAKTYPSTFALQNLGSSDLYDFGQVQHGLAGYNSNNIITLPHYVLWKPSDLIGLVMDVPIQNPVGTVTDMTFVTLAGIEYRMPPGKG
jgi:hypothetical protein